MRLRQRVEKLEVLLDSWLEAWGEQIEDNKNEIWKLRRQLNCPHEGVEFRESTFWLPRYSKVCADCGLQLKSYDSREDWLKDKAKWMKAEAARLEKEAKEKTAT